MKTKTRLFSLLLIVITLLCMTSCGSKEEPIPANYERPAVTMAKAIAASDTKAYLNCFTDEAKSEYINGNAYNKDLVKTFLPSQSESIIKTRTTSDTELNQRRIDELKEQYKEKYKKRIDISKARKLTVEFTIQGEDKQSVSKELTVVRVENSWLIFGDVIEEFDFQK